MSDAQKTETKPMMPTCSIELKTTQWGTTVPLTGVTPAEMLFLVADNHQQVGGDPITELKETDPVARTSHEEITRLKRKYNPTKMTKIYPSVMAQIPQTFSDARKIGVTMNLSARTQAEMNMLG